MAISLNPGFLLLIAAVLALIAPNRLRQSLMLAASLAAAAACFGPSFGEPIALRQVGLMLSPLRLDATSQIYGFTALLVSVLCAIAAFSRRHRFEDVSLLLLAGGAASAAFAGDLATFVACACLASFGACGLTIATGGPEARNAGLRLLIWHALSALALIGGAALVWTINGAVLLSPVPLASMAGGLLCVGLLIQAGGPFAHVWLRDGVSCASGLGGAAIAAIAPIAAFVGLARLFAGEGALILVGVALAVAPLAFALAEPDWRRSAAFGVISQNGFVLAALGLGTPLGLAGAGASAFAHAIAALALLLAIGAARTLVGADQATGPGAATAARAPSLAAIAVLSGASFCTVPGTAGYAARSLLLEAFGGPDWGIVWAALMGATALAVAHGGFKAPYAAFFGPRPAPAGEPAFPVALAAGLAGFFLVAVGVTPQWIYALAPPGEVFHVPFAPETLAAHVLLVAAAGAAFMLLMWSPFFPAQRPAEILETDWLWRRPGRAMAAALGRGLASAYAVVAAAQDRAVGVMRTLVAYAAALADRPSAQRALGPGVAVGLAGLAVCGLLVAMR